jgi:hypothetical protein
MLTTLDIILSLGYIVTMSISLLCCYVIYSYNSKKPLGMQTFQDRIIQDMLIVFSMANVSTTTCQLSVRLFFPLDYWMAMAIFPIMVITMYSTVVMFLVATITHYLSAFHTTLIDNLDEDKSINRIRYGTFIIVMIMVLFDYGYSLDEEEYPLLNFMLVGRFIEGKKMFGKSLLTISVLNILASISLQIQLERYRNHPDHLKSTKAYSLSSWRGHCFISLLSSLFFLAFPIMNLRLGGVLITYILFDLVPIMSIVRNANIVNHARFRLFR